MEDRVIPVLEYDSVAPARGRGAGVAMLILAAGLWSLSGVVVKVVGTGPVVFTFYRSLSAALVMALGCLFVRGGKPNARWMALSAGLYTAVVLTLITAMTVSTAATGILLQYTGPVFCALLAWMFQGRRIDGRTAVAMGFAVVGIVILIMGQASGGGWLGPACGLVSGFCFGALILVLEKLDRASGGDVNPLYIVAFNNLGCVVLLLPIVAMKSGFSIQPWQIELIAATGVVQLALPYVLFQLALRRVPAVDASLLILLEPVLNPIWVALATSERPGRATVLGGGFILVALVVEAVKKR